MSVPEVESVSPSRIADVAAFVKQQIAVSDWKGRHPEAAAELEAIAAVYNPSLDAAEKAVRARKVSCGPFDLYQFRTSYDPAALLEAVGRQKFASLGGTLETKDVLGIDKERFLAAVAQERIPEAVASKVVKYSACYRAVPRIELP